ncbi:MAG TPA: DUF4340 domain-containing protein [Candidatus Binatia bacterium]|nr:DUF4340 domain-containing protein [Candidatus Binatia bacterium]
MTWRRALIYFATFVVLVVYYVTTEPGDDHDAAAAGQRRSFLSATPGEVQTVTVERGATRIQAVRDGDRWRVVEPEHAPVPSDLLAALVEQLTALPDVEVVSESGAEAEQFGLVPPSAHVTLGLSEGRHIGVALGGRNPGQTAVYARVDGTIRIVLVGLNVLYYQDLITQAAGLGSR